MPKGKTQKKASNILVMGGGTGTFTVLSGLKKFPKNKITLSAIVPASDSGGSTGRLRDEFGYLPVGDVRMALVALAETDNGENGLRDLFLYRFERGNELSGHNVGNLLLVAMTEMLGSEEKAIEMASKILRVRGRVLPVASGQLTLVAEYADGSVIKGETHIDEPHPSHDGTQRIQRLSVEEKSTILPTAQQSILNADLVVLGPGDLYTSTLANVVVSGISEALQNTRGKLLYVVNLMTRYGQTHDFTAKDHVKELTKYTGRKPDVVLINTAPLPREIIHTYKKQNEFLVKDDLGSHDGYAIIRSDFLSPEEIRIPSGDILKRSLIRHDSHKLAQVIIDNI